MSEASNKFALSVKICPFCKGAASLQINYYCACVWSGGVLKIRMLDY